MAKKQSDKVQPIEDVRIGAIKAAIWENPTDAGPRYNVTFQRLYRTEDGKWQSTYSFGAADLLLLAKVADATHTRVLQLLEEQRQRAQAQA